MKIKQLFPTFLLIFTYHLIVAQTDENKIILQSVLSGFNQSVDIANTGVATDTRLFIVEKAGVIRIIPDPEAMSPIMLGTPFLDISSLVDNAGGEQGLLGLVFHPNYATNGRFFVNYIRDPGAGLDRTVVAEYQVSADPNVANPTSVQTIIEIEQDFANHNGGDLNFGPDGNLYIGMGDGGSGNDPNNRAQDDNELLGKMLRINVDGIGGASDCGLVGNYNIPVDNPNVLSGTGCRETWAKGLRNPFRFSFDRQNGNMWIGDVGQNRYEEIDFQPNGVGGINYGWRCCEGAHPNPNGSLGVCCNPETMTSPVFEVDRTVTTGDCSITGGYVYRGTDHPELHGFYICGDFCSQDLYAINASNPNAVYKELASNGNISTFGESVDGELYMAALNGAIFKVTAAPGAVLPIDLIDFDGYSKNHINHLNWSVADAKHFSHFDIERSQDGKSFKKIGRVASENSFAEVKQFKFQDTNPQAGNNFYRLKMVDLDGSFSTSKIITLNIAIRPQINVFPQPANQKMTVELQEEEFGNNTSIKMLDITGKIVFEQLLSAENTATIEIEVAAYQAGIYLLILENEFQQFSKKILIE